MKISIGQKISLIGLIIGLSVLWFLATIENTPKVQAASTTAWQITNSSNAVITTTRGGAAQTWLFQIQSSNGITTYGNVWDNQNTYTDGGTSFTPQNVRLIITPAPLQTINIQAGDTIVLTGDGTPGTLTVYMPAISSGVSVILYVADDGSTYTDAILTTLAYEAPIEIEIALDDTSAYDFGSIIPDQTYTSADNVRNVTVTCNETNGWKLYVKSTGDFESGVNSVDIGSLEWSVKDGDPTWIDMSTTDTEIRSSANPTSASGVTTGMEYQINVDYSSVPADDYTATITYTAVCQ
ncbi:hypothetical protein ACFLZS_00990 [Patescibacteria group bacterium]